MNMNKYFIVKNTMKHGPLSFHQLKEFKISKTDLIWKRVMTTGLKQWKYLNF